MGGRGGAPGVPKQLGQLGPALPAEAGVQQGQAHHLWHMALALYVRQGAPADEQPPALKTPHACRLCSGKAV